MRCRADDLLCLRVVLDAIAAKCSSAVKRLPGQSRVNSRGYRGDLLLRLMFALPANYGTVIVVATSVTASPIAVAAM